MARRKRNNDAWILDVARLVALLFVLGMLSPQFRNAILRIGTVVIWLGGAVIAGLILWALIRAKNANQKSPFTDSRVYVPIPEHGAVESNPFASVPADQLTKQLRTIDWFQFEKVVEVLYRKLGYSVTRRGGANADGGIDLIIERSGERKAVQCKHWKTWNVGVKTVREFLGALTDAGIQRGVFITLGGYTGDARQLAAKHGIEMVNETDLARLLEETHARFDPELIQALTDTRKFCPKCEKPMELKTATKGPNAGKQFWGCSGFSSYPKCRFTMPVIGS